MAADDDAATSELPEVLRSVEETLRLLYGQDTHLHHLGGFENVVFRVDIHGSPISVVRIAEAANGSDASLRAEIAFLEHLATSGVPVPRFIRSIQTNNTKLLATEFEYIRGAHLLPGEMSRIQAVRVGSILRELHDASRSAQPEVVASRPRWHETVGMNIDLIRGSAPKRLLLEYDSILEAIRTIEPDALLVHGDINHLNVIFDIDVHLIDFDDACRASIEFDFAILLTRLAAVENSNKVLARVCGHIVEGYLATNDVPLNYQLLRLYVRAISLQGPITKTRHPEAPGPDVQAGLGYAWLCVVEDKLPKNLNFVLEQTWLNWESTVAGSEL